MRLGPPELILLLIAIPLYFLPTIVAVARHHRNAVAIVLINILTGWTGIGWIVALVWSFINPTAPKEMSQNVNQNINVNLDPGFQKGSTSKSVAQGNQGISFCTACGQKLDAAMQFCPKCGAQKSA